MPQWIKYCQKNDYQLEKENYQIRELFKNKNKILARITSEIEKKKRTCVLDFKDDNNTEVLIKEARETIPITVSRANRKAIDSMLEMLEFYKDKTLKRKRISYIKSGVKFEIDEYIEPEKCFVVAIEGEKEVVDKTYKDVKIKITE